MVSGAQTMRASLLRAYREELWRRKQVWPLLEEYLDRDQIADLRAFFGAADAQKAELPKDDWYDEISRQRGKSYKWCVLSVVWCNCHPRQLVKYAAQLGKSVRNIIWPTINALVSDMPPEMRGKGETPDEREQRVREDRQDHKWRFPGGSELMAAGMNGDHEDDLRGNAAHLFIKDECGFYTRFPKVEAVSRPQLLTTGGVSVYATTPPESPQHPVRLVREALKGIGRYVHRTIYNHPRFSDGWITDYLAKEARTKGLTLEAFKQTTYYLREFLCLWVTESTRAVIPEWSAAAGPPYKEGSTWGDACTSEAQRPLYFHTYDALDIGFTRDPSAWLAGYWDWDAGRLVIEDESPPMFRKRAEQMAAEILPKRRALWPASGPKPYGDATLSEDGTYWLPYVSVGDAGGNGAERLTELATEGVHFSHAKKADLETMINAVRTLVAQGKLHVHPRCVTLRRQLATGLWADTGKTDFERDELTGEHLDHVAALMYLTRHVDRQMRPVPYGYGVDTFNRITHSGQQSATIREVDNAVSAALGGVEW